MPKIKDIAEKKGLGTYRNQDDNRDIPLAVVAAALNINTAVHPKKNITDISMLPVEDQGQLGTCVGQAEGKGEEYRDYKETGIVTRLSKRFIYTECKKIDNFQGQGTYPRIAAKVLTDLGAPREDLLKDNNNLPYEEYLKTEITAAIKTEASGRRVKGYTFPATLDEMKTAIDIAGIFNASLQVGDWNSLPVKPTYPNGTNRGLHRIKVYGYEDAKNGGVDDTKIYYRNSWGLKWANAKTTDDKKLQAEGNGWLWYSEYSAFMYDMIVYVDMPNEIIDYAKAQVFLFPRTLKPGMHGTDVMELQKRLSTEKGADGQPCYNYKENGQLYFGTYYGSNTQKGVERYQIVKGIVLSGTPQTTGFGQAGPMTIQVLNGGTPPPPAQKKTLLEAQIQVESGGNDNAIGDKNLTYKAYGCLQIRQPVCIDVNAVYGTKIKAIDMLGNRKLSIDTWGKYLGIYATKAKIGREATDQDKARIWNGGPAGYRIKATEGYWKKVNQAMSTGAFSGTPLCDIIKPATAKNPAKKRK